MVAVVPSGAIIVEDTRELVRLRIDGDVVNPEITMDEREVTRWR